MVPTDDNNKDKNEKKILIQDTGSSGDNETSGETSSVADFDRASATKNSSRKNKPLGSSHEPGTMPGTEI